ncbi:multimeric flavodoxin WrbA [Melghirimyces profundicolus]|uniref:Multimeric flavodoxin WrbA n=1 Tax=Melghirimyces profundicolus TaxID=1242148 RepID=A0A2T6BXR0_9BACL|nr:flavodoxin family protein [Melghirimyces profundicolus]PTX60806.1 multimeric flavodoxin WrbA [Melghirimyces profundicolus]
MGIAVLYGSSRKNGNSERLARLLVRGFDADHIYLTHYRIEPIVDYRHVEPGPYPDDDYRKLMNRVLKQDTLVFATAIYWYGLPGRLKLFIDRWSQSLRENRGDFLAKLSGKQAYVIAVGDDEPHVKGQPLIQQFQYIFDFVGIRFAGHVIGTGNRPEDIEQDAEALSAIQTIRFKLSADGDSSMKEP